MACSAGDGVQRRGEPKRLFPCESENSSRSSSPDLDASLDVDEMVRVRCSCKSTCQRKQCPCKVAGVFCGDLCACGTKKKPCKNRAITEHDDVTATSVDTASVRELQARNVQDYVATLSNEQCHRLIVEAYSHNGGLELAKALLSAEPPPPNQPENSAIPWCICGKCRTMTTDAEKKCCRQRKCITLDPSFHSLVLDREALAVAIVHRSDFFAGVPVYTPESYRKAAYRQYIIWRYHRLGRGNRRVVPSCVVWAVRDKYPAADGNYLGFKEF